MERSEVVSALLTNRAFMYRFLARAFAQEADASFLGVAAAAQDQCAVLDGPDDRRGGELAERIWRVARTEGVVEPLAYEYTRLFLGPAELPVPPWESVFVTRRTVLFQRSTLEVRAAYTRAGFVSKGYPHEADDHLAVELSFLAALAKEALDSFEGGDLDACKRALGLHAAFLEEHLLVWVDEFAQRLGEAAGAESLYTLCAELAALYAHRDAVLCAELLEHLAV